MYILYASCISVILFSIYHYININSEESENPNKKYDISDDLLTINNIIVFAIILAFSITLIYFSMDENTDILSMIGITDNDYSKLNNISKKTLVDPHILKNTSEPMSSGFEPYTSGGSVDNSESSSDSSSETSNDSD
jgi:amino acid permease